VALVERRRKPGTQRHDERARGDRLGQCRQHRLDVLRLDGNDQHIGQLGGLIGLDAPDPVAFGQFGHPSRIPFGEQQRPGWPACRQQPGQHGLTDLARAENGDHRHGDQGVTTRGAPSTAPLPTNLRRRTRFGFRLNRPAPPDRREISRFWR